MLSKRNNHILSHVSPEALVDSDIRLVRNLRGNPEKIIGELLLNDIKTDKTFYSEKNKFDINISPNRRRPFSLCSTIATGSVSLKTKKSAGFFFWETNRGYNFFAADSLCATKESEFRSENLNTEAFGPYIERLGNQTGDVDSRNNILKSVFSTDMDVFTALRTGRYNSNTATFNLSTGEYKEHRYNYYDQYANQAHLGGQESLDEILELVKILKQTKESICHLLLTMRDGITNFQSLLQNLQMDRMNQHNMPIIMHKLCLMR